MDSGGGVVEGGGEVEHGYFAIFIIYLSIDTASPSELSCCYYFIHLNNNNN